MKRGNLLRMVTSVAIALFVANGLFGQVQGGADYVAISGAATEIDSVTVGTTTRLYVKPDAYFHPGYVTPGWTLTADFTWTWDISAAVGSAVDAGESTNDVWVQVDWSGTAGGPYSIKVTETAPAAFGGCSGDTNVWVSVIPSPTITFTANNPGTIIGANITVCEGDALLAGVVQATLTGIRSLQLQWTLEIATLDATSAKDEYFNLAKTSLGGAQAFAVNRAGTVANPQETDINALTFNLNRPTDGNYTAIQPGAFKKSTVYTYVINGVNDRISRKSDYLSNPTKAATGWDWYDTTAETITIRVNPAPVTGPIYHIPNNWAQ